MNAPVIEWEMDNMTAPLYTIEMFPVLFSIGQFTLYTSSIFMILAFLTTGYFFWRKGREEHYPEDEIFDVYLISVFWAVLASRLGFILIHFEHFGLQPLKWIDIFSTPGFIPFFGLIAAAIVIYRQAKSKKWDAFEVLDFAAISVAFG